jgi:hypothetical protein
MPFAMTKYHYDKHGRYQGKTSDTSPGGGLLGLIGGVSLLVIIANPALFFGVLWALFLFWLVFRFSKD